MGRAVDRVLLSVALTLACEDEPREPENVAAILPDVPPPILAGCFSLDADVCERPPAGNATWCQPSLRRANEPAQPEMKLALWYDDANAALSVRIDGVEATAGEASFVDGQRLDLEVPPTATRLAVFSGPHAIAEWRIVDAAPEPKELEAARAALALSAESPEHQRLQRELEAATPTFADDMKLRGLELLADLAFQDASLADAAGRKGAWQTAVAASDAAYLSANAASDSNRASCHARRTLFAALKHVGDPREVDRWSDRLRASSEGASPRTVAHNAYYEGWLAERQGEPRLALEKFRFAEHGAMRWGDGVLAFGAQQEMASVYASLGLDEAVGETLERARQNAVTQRCRDWLMALNYEGWTRLQLRESGRDAGDPIAPLEEAHMLLTFPGDAPTDPPSDQCADAWLGEHVALDLALAAAAAGWYSLAEEVVATLPAIDDGAPELVFWREELVRRTSVGRGDPGALVDWLLRFEDWEALTPDQVWIRAWGRGQAYEVLGIVDDALEAYAKADQAAAEIAMRLDHDGGRDHVSFGHHRSAGRRADLLVARGEVDRAACIARLARRRTNAQLDRAAQVAAFDDERRRLWREYLGAHAKARGEIAELEAQRWNVPMEQRAAYDELIAILDAERRAASKRALDLLSMVAHSESTNAEACSRSDTPRDGELELLYFPSGVVGRWLAFARSGDAHWVAEVTTLPDAGADPERWSDALLGPFSDAIAAARTIHVLPSAELWSVSFGALPWGDDVLLAHASVTYGLDLDRPDPAADPSDRSALVVVDPDGSLEHAAAEGSRVVKSLEARGWNVSSLVGEEASVAKVSEALAKTEWFHYAGHGSHEGLEGWHAALRVAHGEGISVEDVLAVPKLPSVAVLPACSTMPTDQATLGGGMSIGRAFLLGGADVVIGTVDEIDDRVAMRVVSAFYQAHGDTEPARALRQAQLIVRRDPSVDESVRDQWSLLRVLTPD